MSIRTDGPSDGCIYYGGLFLSIFVGVLLGLFLLEWFGVITIG